MIASTTHSCSGKHVPWDPQEEDDTITSLNSTFQEVHISEVEPQVPGDPRVLALGSPKADSGPGKTSNIYTIDRTGVILTTSTFNT